MPCPGLSVSFSTTLRTSGPPNFAASMDFILVPLLDQLSGRTEIGLEKDITHCLREWRAFPNHSTQSSAGPDVWSAWP